MDKDKAVQEIKEIGTQAGSIPSELFKFFSDVSSRSLLVKGVAGTGKTTFALQLIESLKDIEHSIYITTRVSDEALYSQFKWLKEKEWHDRLIDSSRGFLRALVAEHVNSSKVDSRIEGAKAFLKTVHGTQEPRTSVDRRFLRTLFKDISIEEIENIYDRVQAKLPARSLVIIDSIDALAERYDVPHGKLLTTLQKDLVENSNTSMVIVSERSTDTTLDFYVDGVVTLHQGFVEGRRFREMSIEKLRGLSIKQARYPYTLLGGKFRYFQPFASKVELMHKTHQPICDSPGSNFKEGLFSTGNHDLDALVGGGYPKGAFILIELGDNVPQLGVMYMVGPTVENFLTQHRGVVGVAPGGLSSEIVRTIYAKVAGEENVREYARIIERKRVESKKKIPSVVKIDSSNIDSFLESWIAVEDELHQKTNAPVLITTSWDTLEYGLDVSSAERIATSLIPRHKTLGYLHVGVIRPGIKIAQMLRNMADVLIKVVSLDGALMCFGEKPRTEIYNIDLDEAFEHAHLKLTPIN